MRAILLERTAAVDELDLRCREVQAPSPGPGEILLRVLACGVCRTDLHIVEGDVPLRKKPVIPGHQIVGRVERTEPGATRFQAGQLAGVTWLHATCGDCEFCRGGRENLCDASTFTGLDADGGYAEYAVAREDFAVPLPASLEPAAAAPFLCAGVIGYRALRLSGVQPGERLGLIGFGASAHIALQVARHLGCEVFVYTRSTAHASHARELGATRAGPLEEAEAGSLHGAIVFAPAGAVVPPALRALRKGGTLAVNAIHMSPIPSLPYNLLYHERTLRSVANCTRADAVELLRLAAEIPIRTDVVPFPLERARDALLALKRSELRGAAVLVP
jgi:alcohol dehydrogenase, propanol-preferring